MNGGMKYVGYALLVVIAGFWLRAGFIWFYPYRPTTIHAINILDSDNVVTAGDVVHYETIYTKHIAIPSTISRWLVNSYIIPITPYVGQVPLGEGKSINPILVPDFASPGVYRLTIEYTYHIGSFPTRIVKVQASSGKFTIVKKLDSRVENRVEELNLETMRNTEAIRGMKEKVARDEKTLKMHRERSTYDPAR